MNQRPESTNRADCATRPAGRLAKMFADGAAAWNVAPRTLLTMMAIPLFIVAFGIGTGLVGKAAFKWFADEDGVAEYLQIVFYGLALAMSIWVARLWFQRGERLISVLFLILTCGFVFLIGEEISWGQRIVGWSTPEDFAAINKQHETNLHNIHGVGESFKWIQMLVGAYGTVLPLLFLMRPGTGWLRRLTTAVVPHWTLIPFFAAMFLWKAFRNLYGEIPRYSFALATFNEVVELILSIGFFLFLLFQVVSLKRNQTEPFRESEKPIAVPSDEVQDHSAAGVA